MGKKQHQKDKLYLTNTEWRTEFGGFKEKQNADKFRRLPFHCCSLSLQPFEHPYCTKHGIIYDLINIVPFLKKYGKNPVTGEKMSMKQMIKLNFFKNSSGNYHCPVTYKVFNENTHIMAVATSGNVYSYEAVQQLNIKTSNFQDLMTSESFTRQDLITLQDPLHLNKFNISEFFYLKNDMKVIDEELEQAKKDPKYHLKCINSITMEALKELDEEYKAKETKQAATTGKLDKLNSAHYSTGAVAAAFTSTTLDPNTQHTPAIIDEEVLVYERVKKKGYIRLTTNKGILNLELHCEMVPKTCDNFIKLCSNGYYKNTIFHRSIRNFMIQGGDPDGTGKGGNSIWEKPFKDEFKPNLTHSGRGVLSMANSGPNTNKSQFFITFRSCGHLDNKHSVFGKVVGGLETLNKMEKIETDDNDKPLEDIIIEDTIVFVDPFKEAEELLKKEREDEIKKEEEEKAKLKSWKVEKKSSEENNLVAFKQGVGKYINPSVMKRSKESDTSDVSDTTKKKTKLSTGFGDFSTW
ncbi:RING-type E3 ubiquitin-protein ligase PPIL2 [Octopus bimaculoides]|uniref:RING-type E3 ubiquitin-protein ligase PPIL2 n=1 Tax=Octopus bimaculoides TaxID=37653 RepID=UPI00071CDD42|nr:RING-type E3 ubiquitin-protein ligase PPIL2 [Octopus bimaculoides]XP_014775999.1 RING-type E3 ubiquitin-protein ligase PPIL2 [Octopus bimaculoides]XP_052832723.1 RING-type E3 ubiquitin-protein ligase PPIL2 [Octopus bimaculoides]|eukprot:XP_014775998.1 PREDICTED: peptidyl-prolyl cis-trans isomerase-like 2 [Octopus bimaculoides]